MKMIERRWRGDRGGDRIHSVRLPSLRVRVAREVPEEVQRGDREDMERLEKRWRGGGEEVIER